jgi:hypothetical protein
MTTHPLFLINDFFDDYAAAIESFNSKSMAHCYTLPCSFISQENSSVFSDATQLEGFFSKGTAFYKKQGIVNTQPEVRNKILWAENIAKVKLIWHYYNVLSQPVYSCDYEYILIFNEEIGWKISAAVSLNEKQRMEEWLAYKQAALSKEY